MWSNLPAEEKSMLVAMAALEKKESHNIKLTDDLRNLDVKKVLDIDDIDDGKYEKKHILLCYASQNIFKYHKMTLFNFLKCFNTIEIQKIIISFR